MCKQGRIEVIQSNRVLSEYHQNRALPMEKERMKQTGKVESQEEKRSNKFKL